LTLMFGKTISNLLSKVKITQQHAIVFKDIVSIDGHYENSIVRIVTHAHKDHLYGLNVSVKESSLIAMTKATHDILLALGYRLPKNKTLPLNYEQEFRIGDLTLSLHKAKHIIGAAQVLAVDPDNSRLVYTGDFKLPSTPILEADLLIIEATYGNPEHTRPFKYEVESLFIDLVKSSLPKGPVYIFGYHGKLQEAMEILRSGGIDAPFIAPKKVYDVTLAAMKHGLKVEGLYYDKTLEAEEIMRSKWYVYFAHMNTPKKTFYHRVSSLSIVLSGWEFKEPLKRINDKTYLVALSDHADFEQLLEYVEESKPKVVVTDASREGSAHMLAKEIRRRFSIPAIALP